MRLLLDTHAFLWFLTDNPQLSAHGRDTIEDSANEILLSVASAWEMAIKISLGKLAIDGAFATLIPEQLARNSIGLLPVTLAHAAAVVSLPFHHRDPFDRLLIAQSLVESMPIISADSIFDAYGVTRMW